MYFHLGRRRTGQDGGIYTGLVSKGLLSLGAFWEGVQANLFQVNLPLK